MDAMRPDIKGSLFAGFTHGDFEFLGHLFDHFLNTTGMNPTIADKLQQRQVGQLRAVPD